VRGLYTRFPDTRVTNQKKFPYNFVPAGDSLSFWDLTVAWCDAFSVFRIINLTWALTGERDNAAFKSVVHSVLSDGGRYK